MTRPASRPSGLSTRFTFISIVLVGMHSHSPAQPAPAAASETDGARIAIEESHLRESNPLRLAPDLLSTSDTALVSTLDATYRKRWSRQQLLWFGRYSSLHYSNQPSLDHEPYRIGAALDLQTVGDWGVRVNALHQRDALEGQLRLDPLTGQRRVQALEQTGGALVWGIQRRWSLQSDWQHERLQPNRPQVWWPGYAQDTWRLQARADLANAGFLSIGRRYQDGKLQAVDAGLLQAPAVNYRMDVWDFEWSAQSRSGDSLTLRGATGHGHRRSADAGSAPYASAPDAGSTSAIESLFADIRWQPASALTLQAMASRDLGQQTQATQSWIAGEGLFLQGANDVRQVRLGIQWDLRRGWQLAITRQRMDRMGEQAWYAGSNQSAAWPLPRVSWQDRLDRRSTGLTWQVNQSAVAQCSVRLETRSGMSADDLRVPVDARGLRWKDRMSTCSLRWQFRVPS